MVVTIESKVTINGKFYATGPRPEIFLRHVYLLCCYAIFLLLLFLSSDEDERHIGCFTDMSRDRVFPDGPCDSPPCLYYDDLTIDTCIELCRAVNDTEYAYAGVELGNECYCGVNGTDYSRHGRRGDDACQYPCSGNGDYSCGGGGAIAVYSRKL